MNKIYIIGRNVPSKKNSKMITKSHRIISSKLTRDYEKWSDEIFTTQLNKWKDMINGKELPLLVHFYFYRDSKRHWDFVNIVQTIADIMQEKGYLEDDDTQHFIPVYDGEEVVKKDKSGVVFWVE